MNEITLVDQLTDIAKSVAAYPVDFDDAERSLKNSINRMIDRTMASMNGEGFCVEFELLWILSGYNSIDEALCDLFIMARENYDYIKKDEQYYLKGSSAAAYLITGIKKNTGYFSHKKVGYVYFISSNGLIKIGKTTNLENRLSALQASNPNKLEMIGYIECDNPSKLEKTLHNQFFDKRIHNEWFCLNNDDISSLKKLEGFITR